MLETINKLNTVSNILFEVVPHERMKKWANKILVKPIERANKKLGNTDDSTAALKASISDFVDKLSPTTLATLAFSAVTLSVDKPQANEVLTGLLEQDIDPEKVKDTIVKVANIVERNSNSLGKIVENLILISSDAKKEFSEQDEEEDTSSDDSASTADGEDFTS